jgi:lipoprotein-anchoring transpeptidase ErfK/SrfK
LHFSGDMRVPLPLFVLSLLAFAPVADAAGHVVTEYRIIEADLAGPFVADIPGDVMEQSALTALGYRTPLEKFGERFHASPTLLQRLNPGATFTTAGEMIRVPNVPPPSAEPSRVGRTESHGCVRLTNWDAMRVAALVAKGTRVVFEE